MLIRTLKSLSSWSRRHAPARLRRWAERVETLPVGRRYRPQSGLGLMQRWYAAQPIQRIVISVLELGTPIGRDLVELAVRGMCARHPGALGVCELRSRSELRIRPLTAADPVPWFEAAASRDVWQLSAAMLHRPFEADAPLFRVAIAADGRAIVAAFDHLIADGVSAGIFAAELGAIIAGDALLPTAADAALPLDARLDLRPSIAVLARALQTSAHADLLVAPRASGPAFKPASAPLRTQLLATVLPRELIDALIREARWRSLTLHAVLSAAALLAALEALEAKHEWVRLTTPISLRDQCRPLPDGLGVFIASVESELELTALDDPWLLAQRCRDDIARQRPEAHRTVGLLALAGDLESLAAKYDRIANGRTATVEVSNVGRIRGVPSGAAVWLTQGAHYHAASFVLTVATSDSDGSLRACLSYPAPLIGRERADRFVRAFERTLLQMRDSSIGASAVDA
jgi:hypothetical protein